MRLFLVLLSAALLAQGQAPPSGRGAARSAPRSAPRRPTPTDSGSWAVPGSCLARFRMPVLRPRGPATDPMPVAPGQPVPERMPTLRPACDSAQHAAPDSARR
jgi:hypothetical protein